MIQVYSASQEGNNWDGRLLKQKTIRNTGLVSGKWKDSCVNLHVGEQVFCNFLEASGKWKVESVSVESSSWRISKLQDFVAYLKQAASGWFVNLLKHVATTLLDLTSVFSLVSFPLVRLHKVNNHCKKNINN